MSAIIDTNDEHKAASPLPARRLGRSQSIWGVIGHLTSEQQETLTKFTAEAPPQEIEAAKYTVESEEQCSLRFLRARQFDCHKALTLLSDCYRRMTDDRAQHWASLTPDECALCDVDALKNWYPHNQRGFDKFHRPILIEQSGGLQPNAVLNMTTKQHLINYHWWTMENALDSQFTTAKELFGAEYGSVNISTLVIIDLTGLSMATHFNSRTLDHVKSLTQLDNLCYPETLGKLFFVNCPWMALNMWSIVKSWLDPRTQDKIEILGTGPEMHARLLEFIDPENLPKAFGGTGPDIFPKREHADYVNVGRGGHVSKSVVVPAGKALTVDSYITEGSLEITVTYVKKGDASDTKAYSAASKHLFEHGAHAEQPTRHLQTFPAAEEDREYTATWTNPSRFYTRNLTYVLTARDP